MKLEFFLQLTCIIFALWNQHWFIFNSRAQIWHWGWYFRHFQTWKPLLSFSAQLQGWWFKLKFNWEVMCSDLNFACVHHMIIWGALWINCPLYIKTEFSFFFLFPATDYSLWWWHISSTSFFSFHKSKRGKWNVWLTNSPPWVISSWILLTLSPLHQT